MSMEHIQATTNSPDDTYQLAEQIGRHLKGGEVVELISDLGGGKTAFTRGLAKGMGSQDSVSSPSFTLRNEYKAGELTLYHFDFYRLQEAGILTDELQEVLDDPQAVTVIEWATIVEAILPEKKLTIQITATGEQTRQFTFEYPENLAYLVEGVI